MKKWLCWLTGHHLEGSVTFDQMDGFKIVDTFCVRCDWRSGEHYEVSETAAIAPYPGTSHLWELPEWDNRRKLRAFLNDRDPMNDCDCGPDCVFKRLWERLKWLETCE
jgi:hypothetical protein